MALVKTGILTPQKQEVFFQQDDSLEDFVICKNPKKLERLLEAIQSGKTIHYISDGDWSMHNLVMELLKMYRPANLYFTTYALREFPVRQLIMAQGKKDLLSVNMIIDYRAKARTPEVYQLASMNMNRVFMTSIHAKVTVLKSTTGSVSICGSANWTQNPRIEAGIISTNEKLASFHINWIEKVMDHAELFK